MIREPASVGEKLFIHCCCDVLVCCRVIPISFACGKFFDIMKDIDCTNDKTVREVKSMLRGPEDVFVYCSPFTGGSTWQRLKTLRLRRETDGKLRLFVEFIIGIYMGDYVRVSNRWFHTAVRWEPLLGQRGPVIVVIGKRIEYNILLYKQTQLH